MSFKGAPARTKPPHVDQGRVEDALDDFLTAAEQDINIGHVVRLSETIEAANKEMEYFHEPANAANIGRLEAFAYAWKTEFLFRNTCLVMGVICAFMATVMLMGQSWQSGIPHAMQIMGPSGFYPTLFGAIWLHSPRRNFGVFLAYHVRAAPLLLTCGGALIAIGLLGTWLT